MTKRKPTLSQLKKRPSLWVSDDDNLRFVYPDGRMVKFQHAIYPEDIWLVYYNVHKSMLFGEYEFIGWL